MNDKSVSEREIQHVPHHDEDGDGDGEVQHKAALKFSEFHVPPDYKGGINAYW